MRRRIAGVILLLLASLGASPAAALDEAGEAAAAMLRTAVTPRSDAAHEALLEALRRLHDPALRPFFQSLALAPQPSLQLHGLLGVAELDPAGALPIAAIGEIEYAPLQAELIAAAMDLDLLPAADAKQLLRWSGLALPVKLVIATRLAETRQFDDASLLAEALKSEKLGQRGLAALLLHQMGDARGAAALGDLDQSTDRTRDAVRSELLRTAVRHKFERVADWALGIATEREGDEQMQWSGLAAAMRFGHRPAAARWKQLYEASADNPGRRRLLGLMALRVAPFVEAGVFDPMLSSDDALVADMGRAGRAIALDGPDLTERVTALLRHGHPMVNNWALGYADHARPDTAQLVLIGLIAAYQPGDARDRAARLDDAAQATVRLMELDPVAGGRALRPILAETTTQPLLRQAILTGLLRVKLADLDRVVEGLSFQERDTARLALVLRARGAGTLTDAEMDDLRLVVRGGSSIQGTLRIQAAWSYLKRTNQTDAAIARALQP